MPFSFPKQRETVSVISTPRTVSGNAVSSAGIAAFASIPKPILVLLVHLISTAVMFSLVAGLPLLVCYALKDLSMPVFALTKALFPYILLVDLLLLLLSVANLVFRALRDI